MPVSRSHEQLVQSIVRWIKEKDALDRDIALHVDNVLETTKYPYPPNINGHVPDVYAKETQGTGEMIGEAKTSKDLESPRTKIQLEAYVKYLKHQQDGILIIATPWVSVNSARGIVRSIVKRLSAQNIQTHFLNFLSY